MVPEQDMPRCAACGHPLASWRAGAVCAECGSRVGPWRPVQGKSLRGKSKLLVVGWPFGWAVLAGVSIGLRDSFTQHGQSPALSSYLFLSSCISLPCALFAAVANTGITTFFMVRHAQRKKWVPPERTAAKIWIAVLIGLAASVAGGAAALGLALGACQVTTVPYRPMW